MAAQYLALDSFWVDRSNYTEAEQKFYERLGHETLTPLVAEFVKARETIKELRRQANEAADVIGDGLPLNPVKENKNDNNAGIKLSKKQKQKAAKEQREQALALAKNAKNNAEKHVDSCEVKTSEEPKQPQEKIEQPQVKPTPQNTPPPPQSPKVELETATETSVKQPTVLAAPATPPQTPQVKETKKEEVKKAQQTNKKQDKQPAQQKAASVVDNKQQKSDKVEVQTVQDAGSTAMDCEPVKFLEKKMLAFTDMMAKVQSQLEAMDARLSSIEKNIGGVPQIAVCPAKPAPVCAKPAAKPAADDDDDVDLFGSDSEDDEAVAKLKEARVAAYNAKKTKKPALIAKSSILLDVKPWDDETDMKKMEEVVRKITCDGLLWGASKLVPLAYGIKKLQINCVVEDEKVSIDWLQETIEENEDYVQSVDIAAFNKI